MHSHVEELSGLASSFLGLVERLKSVEDTLREAEEFNAQVLASAQHGMVILDRELRYHQWNPAMEQITGIPAEQVLGRTVQETFPFLEQAGVVKAMERALAGESVQTQDFSYEIAATGRKGFASQLVGPMRNARGEIIGVISSVLETTERKKNEEHICRLNRTYAMLSDINQLIVCQRDPQIIVEESCRIALVKGGFRLAWIGLTDSADGRLRLVAHAGAASDTLTILHQIFTDSALGCAFTKQALETGRHAICNNIARDALAVPWRGPALERGYFSLVSLPLVISGKCVGTFNLYAGETDFFDAEELLLLDELAADISFALDVCQQETRRLAAEAELRWKTTFLEALVESSLDGIAVVDNQAKRILQNQRMSDLFKIPRHIAENKHAPTQLQFVTSQVKDPGQFAEKVAHLYSHPDEISRDIVELANGTILDRSSSPVQDKAGNYYGRIWSFRDITKQHQIEEQLRQSQKMEAIGQLAGAWHMISTIFLRRS